MSALFFRPTLFARFSEVVALHSLRDPSRPDGFSMLHGAPDEVLDANRAAFVREAGFEPGRLAFPRLEHSKRVVELSNEFSLSDRPAGDAILTDKPGWLIGVTVADCVVVLLYDPAHHAIGAAHSGWRGSAANVAGAAITAMRQHYHTEPSQLYAYVSPAPARDEYEVGFDEVAAKFEPKYSTRERGGKAWFDNQAVVYDQLLAAGVPAKQIERDRRSTIADPHFHSYRRDGRAAGRMLVAIGVRAV